VRRESYAHVDQLLSQGIPRPKAPKHHPRRMIQGPQDEKLLKSAELFRTVLTVAVVQTDTENGSSQIQAPALHLMKHPEHRRLLWEVILQEQLHFYHGLKIVQGLESQRAHEMLLWDIGQHRLSAFNKVIRSEMELGVFCCLVDRVGKHQLAQWLGSTYAPLRQFGERYWNDEIFHINAGFRIIENLLHGPEKIAMHDLLEELLFDWVPDILAMFGKEKGSATEQLALETGIKWMTNSETRQRYYDRELLPLSQRWRVKIPDIDSFQEVFHALEAAPG
jgi:1,2-phenylacetyl-CoA epoxidase catalytic subunit